MEQSDTQRLNEFVATVEALKEQLIPFEVGVKGNLQGLIRDVTDLLNRVARIEAARVTPAEAQRKGGCECGHQTYDHHNSAGHCYRCPCISYRYVPPTSAEARESDPVCNCTHRAEDHITGIGACNLCRCDQFDTFDPDLYPLAPEPAPTVALDPTIPNDLTVDERMRIADYVSPDSTFDVFIDNLGDILEKMSMRLVRVPS